MDKSVVERIAPTRTKLKIKRENFDEDIKEFAETAMNELLGWYGYGAPRDDVKSVGTCQSNSNSNSSGPDSPKYSEGCGWCGKPVDENVGLSSGASAFCSELCFSQSRRANFKKNKTCDWCRHVRHTVSYVDFQDGASQLQFCSDKCLNQYKMHIFCRETRAHLEMHPHLPVDDSVGGLITPDLWMKNCKSPESRTPSPSVSPRPADLLPQTSPLPLITLTHPSKLMASPAETSADPQKRQRNTKTQRKQRKRCPSTVTCASFANKTSPEAPQDLRMRHSPVNGDHFREDASKGLVASANNLVERIPNPFFYPPNSFPLDPRLAHPPFFNPVHLPPPVKPPSSGILPPVTVLVPYPILVPVPLPIPVPLPLSSFLKADEKRKELGQNTNNPSQKDKSSATTNDPVTVSSQKKVEECSQVEVNDVEQSRVVQNGVVRPLRKRKKVVDPKSKILVKNKKPLSV